MTFCFFLWMKNVTQKDKKMFIEDRMERGEGEGEGMKNLTQKR